MKDVPFVVYEATMSRLERTIKRLWILCIILIFLLVGTNIAWLIYESQYEYVTTTETYQSEVNDGGIAISNGSGDVRVGEE